MNQAVTLFRASIHTLVNGFIFRFLIFITDVSRELSLHPIHLTPDKEGNLPPSALIPFCSYQGLSSLLGQELPEMDNLTVCEKFQPTILEGQLCYTLDSAILKEYTSKSSKSSGLLLLLDPYPYHLNHKYESGEGSRVGDQSFKVYVNTLAQFTAFGPGSYAMTLLKKMTGTSSFRQLPDHQKKCHVHNREECQTQKYLEQIQKVCKCMPWTFHKEQVTGKI